MADPSDLLQRLQPIFQDVFDDSTLRVGRDASAENVAGWDSLAQVNLVAAIEKEWRIRFTIAELADLKNVGEMLDLIERKLAAK